MVQTPHALLSEFQSYIDSNDTIQKRMEEIRESLLQATKALHANQKSFDDKRIELMLAHLEQNDQSWCTRCKQIFKKDELTLIFIRGEKIVTRGSDHDRGDAPEKFARLHQACPNCAKEFRDCHGRPGEYDSRFNLTPILYAFETVDTDGVIVARIFGDPTKLEEGSYDDFRGILRDETMRELSKKLNLPPTMCDHPFSHEDPFIAAKKFFGL